MDDERFNDWVIQPTCSLFWGQEVCNTSSSQTSRCTQVLRIEVFDEDFGSADDLIGSVSLTLDQLISSIETGGDPIWKVGTRSVQDR